MSAPKTYSVEFTEAEMYGLVECLTNLRTNYLNELSVNGARHQAVFMEACELQLKLSKILNPGHKIPLKAYTS